MKKYFSYLSIALVTFVFASCGLKGNHTSSGRAYELLVVVDHGVWDRAAGRALHDALDSDMPGLPQSEPSFRIMYTSPKDYDSTLKLIRNIIIVDIQDIYTKASFKYAKDVYANPQMILTIQAPNEEEFEKFVKENRQTIINFFTRAEMNRQITGRIATYNFSPTPLSEKNLLDEKAHGNIYVTGNTVVDALHMVVDKLKTDETLAKEQDNVLAQAGYDVARLSNGKKLVLITGHRRENFGDGFIRMVTAMKDLSEKYSEVDFVYPMHLNPNVRKPIHEVFGEDLTRPNFFFIEPLQYLEFVHLMSMATIVLTDSGGIQEEAPGLGKPVLVMRDTTERPEALASGTVHLVGTDYDKIMNEVSILLDDAAAYEKMSKAVNPYGDGQACRRIADVLADKETDRYGVK